MTDKPLVSVIINCYNSEKYLRETIDSLIAQTYDNWEAVFWDNCSTDKTADIIASYQEPRFRYFLAEKNTPLGEARNCAMAKVHGIFVCFLDSDDLLEIFFLQECVDTFKINTDFGFIYCRYTNFTSQKNWLSHGSVDNRIIPTEELIKRYYVGMSGTMINRQILVDYGIQFDPKFSLIEDFDFFLRIASVSRVYYLAHPLMRYRIHEGNSSRSERWENEFDHLIDNIQTKTAYLALLPYLSYIKDLQVYYQLMNATEKHNRVDALRLIWKQCYHDKGVLRYLIPVVFGKKTYLFIRKCLNG